MKRCENCKQFAIIGERFCKDCRKAYLDMMKRSGYLNGDGGRHGDKRSADHKENIYETKRGLDR